MLRQDLPRITWAGLKLSFTKIQVDIDKVTAHSEALQLQDFALESQRTAGRPEVGQHHDLRQIYAVQRSSLIHTQWSQDSIISHGSVTVIHDIR